VAPDLSVKLEGDAVPEEFRGLTLDQLLHRAQGQVQVIKNMGQPRVEIPAPASTPVAPAPSAPALPIIDPDKFREAFNEDPVNALAAALQIGEQRAMAIMEQRIAPLIGNVGSAAEQVARQKYPDEFKLFDKEIREAAAQVPNKQALASPEGWEALVKYVRGDQADRWYEHKRSKETGAPPADPRATAAATTLESFPASPPPSPTNGRKPAGRGYTGTLTDEQREVMKVLDISEEDYRKFYM
jgi:hypothetical protein